MKKIIKIGFLSMAGIVSICTPILVASCSSSDTFGNSVNYAVAANGKRAKVDDIVEGNVDNGNFVVVIGAKWCPACKQVIYGQDNKMDTPWAKAIKENKVEVDGKKYNIYFFSSRFTDAEEESKNSEGKIVAENRKKILDGKGKGIPSMMIYKNGVSSYHGLEETENPSEYISSKIKAA
jgi:thiol-disulfide isomerase/thioredoxin